MFLPDAEFGEVNWNASSTRLDAALESTEDAGVNRPPPKPPKLPSEGGGGTGSSKGASDVNNLVPVSSGAVETTVATSPTARTREPVRVESGNDGVVTQTWWFSSGKDDIEAEQSCGDCASEVAGGASRSAEVGASTKGNRETWTVAGRTTLMMAEGRVALRRFILLTPPPLLAAILPWNRGYKREERSRDTWKWNAEADGRSHGTIGVATANRGWILHLLLEGDQTRRQSPAPSFRFARLERFVTGGLDATTGGEYKIVKSQAGGGCDRSKGRQSGGCGGKEEEGKKHDEVIVKRAGCAIDGADIGGATVADSSICINARSEKERKGIDPLFSFSVNVGNEENAMPPLPWLGFKGHQTQFESPLSWIEIGPHSTESYMGLLMENIFFKQWNPGGQLIFGQ